MFGRQDAANEGPGPNREGHVAMELLPTQDRYNVHLHQNGGKATTQGMAGAQAWFLSLAWWKKALIILGTLAIIIIVILFLTVIIRATTISSPAMSDSLENIFEQAPSSFIDDGKDMDRALRLAGGLKFPTVSKQVPDPADDTYFLQLHNYIMRNYPAIHKAPYINLKVVNKKSLLYTVTGTEPGKLPYLLASHLDVVPANPETWEVPPFSGEIVNNTFIYGRGALDDKGGVFGILEAVEYMISNGDRPKRTFYMAFGHDEEVSGKSGAQEIARELVKRGTDVLDFIVDEGHPITHNVFPGTDMNIALVGVTEKGSLTIQLTVNGTPGHSSFPPWETSIVVLADAVSKLEKCKVPPRLGAGPERYTFEYLAPYVSFGYKMLYSNLWLFAGSMTSEMEKIPQTNAMVRTTTAVTIFNGGNKNNVVPASATAVVNHRIHPTQNVAEILAYDKKVIDDPRVEITVIGAREPHPVSPFGPEDKAYQTVKVSIEQAFPNTVVVPGVLIANTDMIMYLNFTTSIYRFFPSIMEPVDLSRYHGNNERISIQHFSQAVNFYYRVIKNSDLLIDSVPNINI